MMHQYFFSILSVLSFKRAAIGIALLCLSACGFKPLHVTDSSGVNLSNLKVVLANTQDVQDREAGYYMQQRLLDRLGDQDKASHSVTITPRVTRARLGVTGNDVASRYDIRLSAQYELLDIKSWDILERGTVNAVSTFGAPNDPYGLIAADTNGTQQGAKELADRLMLKLATYYSQNKAAPKAP